MTGAERHHGRPRGGHRCLRVAEGASLRCQLLERSAEHAAGALAHRQRERPIGDGGLVRRVGQAPLGFGGRYRVPVAHRRDRFAHGRQQVAGRLEPEAQLGKRLRRRTDELERGGSLIRGGGGGLWVIATERRRGASQRLEHVAGVRPQGDEGAGRDLRGLHLTGGRRRPPGIRGERGERNGERAEGGAGGVHGGGGGSDRVGGSANFLAGDREAPLVELLVRRRADRRAAGGIDGGSYRSECGREPLVRREQRALRAVDATLECGGIGDEGIGRSRGEWHARQERRAQDARHPTHAYHRAMHLVDELQGLPKAELHQHLDGALRPATAVELAADAGIALGGVEDARARLVAPPRCRDQAELLTYFDLPISLLQTAPALTRVSAELIEDLADDGVRYAELRWAPRLHLEAGLNVEEVIAAVAAGITRAAESLGARAPLVGLIVTAMRSHPPAANVRLAEAAGDFGAPVVGFDLAGPEAAYPAPPHAAAFVAAERGGLATTAHAGEVAGPERVVEALDLGVRRIAHGVTAAQDAEVMALLRARDVTLDLCPTSNVQAGIVPDLASHPLALLHRAGVSVTISTDDRTVSDVTLSEELARSSTIIGLTDAELATIALNAFRRAFAPRNVMAPLTATAERAWAGWLAARIS